MTGLRRLAVDAIPSDFQPDTHLALGPWCFFGAEGTYPEWDTLPFIDAFPTPAERCAAGEACRDLAHALLDRLIPEMNRRHGVEFGRAYWHVVLMNWLMHLVMLSWRLWRHVEIFVREQGEEPLEVALTEASDRFRFASTNDFVLACFRPSPFRAWLMSEVVRKQMPEHWRQLGPRRVAPPVAAPLAPVPRRRRAVERVYGMGRWEQVFSAYLNLLPRRPCRRKPERRGNTSGFPPAFLALLDELVETTLPESLGPGFAALQAAAARQRYRPGRIYASCIGFHDDQSNIVLANAVEVGERVLAVQHGGTYGWAALVPLLAELEYWHDVFVTWGWTEHQNYEGRFVPLPSPMLSRDVKRARRSGDEVVLVGAVMYSLNPRLDYYPQPLPYRRAKQRFAGALAPEIFEKLRYRPYMSADSYEDAAWLRRFFPRLRTVDGDLDEAIFGSRLVVLDHPSTTMSRTMAANIPTIGFWDKEGWPASVQGEPLFAELERVGIVFSTPEAAAAQVNAVYGKVKEWWSDPARQKARAAWCARFALADRHWQWRWLKGLAAV